MVCRCRGQASLFTGCSDLGQIVELVRAGEEHTGDVLGGRAALRQDEPAPVLRVEHLVAHAALASAGHLHQHLLAEVQRNRVLLQQAAWPRVQVLRS